MIAHCTFGTLFSMKTISTLKDELRFAQDNNLIEYYVEINRVSIVSSRGTESKHNMILERPYISVRLLPGTSSLKKQKLIQCFKTSYSDVITVGLTTSGASIEIHYEQS